MAAAALDAGCLFALDSDAHDTDQFWYADVARAHARLAGIPASRILNCWDTATLLEWLASKRRPRGGTRRRHPRGARQRAVGDGGGCSTNAHSVSPAAATTYCWPSSS